ncbi:hypothetical protein [Chromobacterium sphagni]|uniref:Uncharacterized protein n=1 Tax=Chromobacterium sphagni TaxID=1903179 RepID=A0A1S1WYM8_9NEIS|nr:hypothetical protein [Chromobacterium sphagni]OHX12403.1 hypothetical protein BI347_02005 [Chromobacterium sphagni]OHX21512.1 hypothetical protein BI344_03005 [Chromobacterium sphagni]
MGTWYVRAWAFAAIVSAIGHLTAPQFMAAGTVWAVSEGWQCEIAIFDLVLATYLLCRLHAEPESERQLVGLLCGLSLLLGLNHLYGGLLGHWGYLHIAGVLANGLAVLLGIGLLWPLRRSRVSAALSKRPQG